MHNQKFVSAMQHVHEALLALSHLRQALADLVNPFEDDDSAGLNDTRPCIDACSSAEAALRGVAGFLFLVQSGEPTHVARYGAMPEVEPQTAHPEVQP
ncbi:MAG: hypothetical protein FJX72_11805 [Armatimonadetes bacterium]|nr:hypothetical protein [Armatimonadota bacterium]